MITLKELTQFLSERSGRPCCPACNSDTLESIDNCKDTSIALLYEDAKASWFGPHYYMRVNPIVCGNCGYVMLFSSDKIDKWKR